MTGHVSYRPEGRMGNALFQMAAVLAYSKLHGLNYSMPSKTSNAKWSPLYFPWLVNPNYNPTLPQIVIKEGQWAFYNLPYKEKWKNWNVVLDGYWQSYLYFDHCREDILKAFRLPWEPINFVGIHVRRGDYLNLRNKHIIQTPEWLRTCIYYFVERGMKSFVVCSDDIAWCKLTLNPLRVSGAEFSYSESGDEIADLALLSCCHHMICSASTFGWWAAWLNQNPDKIILIPDKFFMPQEKRDIDDIVPESWIKIPI